MEQYTVKIKEAYFISSDVKRFVIEKPSGYTFASGQAADIALNETDWNQKFRPFTFTGLNSWENLELLVRIYPERNGVTAKLSKVNTGAELILTKPYGAIEYKGSGVFIAGGTGITPFLSIFRELKKQNRLATNKLIYSNHTSRDVIAGAELHDLFKENYINHYTREGVIGFRERRIDKDILIDYIKDFGQRFYLCGSQNFVTDISKILLELGANTDSLVIEN